MRMSLCLLCFALFSALAGAQAPVVRVVTGCTMVPLPAVAEWVGATLTVDEKERSVTLKWERSSLRMSLNSTLAVLDGKTLTLEAQPAQVDGVLYVPVSLVRKAFNAQATWSEERTKLTFTRANHTKPLVCTAVPAQMDEGKNPADEPLFEAIRAGDLEKVKLLLADNAKLLNKPLHDGQPPLIVAAWADQQAIAKFLIEKGADVKGTFDDEKYTVLHVVTIMRDIELVEILVGKGMDVNLPTKSGVTPLHIACMPPYFTGLQEEKKAKQTTLVEWLLAHKAKVDAFIDIAALMPEKDAVQALKKLPGYGTPMMFAVFADNPDLEPLLVKYGATALDAESKAALVQLIAHERAKDVCTNNLRQIAFACQMWAQEHDERLPKAETIWKDLTIAETIWKDLTINATMLKCPMLPDLANGYGYNLAIAGKPLGDFADPSQILLFADCKSKDNLIRSLEDIDATRHDAAFLAVFLDGHTELITDVTRVKLK